MRRANSAYRGTYRSLPMPPKYPFAERALLQDQNRFLSRMNNEAKVRRSTKSVVLGKVKVMSYEDIEEARAKRAAKEATAGKGKRGRKRKSPPEAGAPEPKAKVARISEAQVAEDEIAARGMENHCSVLFGSVS
jgi:hypothetical protein